MFKVFVIQWHRGSVWQAGRDPSNLSHDVIPHTVEEQHFVIIMLEHVPPNSFPPLIEQSGKLSFFSFFPEGHKGSGSD